MTYASRAGGCCSRPRPALIPNERFFVRNHTATLIIDPGTWRLNVFGSGLRNPDITLSLRDLHRLPSHTTTGYPPDEPPLTRQAVKSAFELPFGAALPAGRRHVLTGRSWSGAAPIRRVDVSTDGGRTFAPADLHGPNRPNAWVRALPPPQARQLRPDRARHRLARAHAAPDCPVQRRRIPVLGRRPPSRPSHLTGGPA